jgi:hypothetical protein
MTTLGLTQFDAQGDPIFLPSSGLLPQVWAVYATSKDRWWVVLVEQAVVFWHEDTGQVIR